VFGSSNQSVTWSLGSPVGTISTAGAYTAPSSITASTNVAIIATSVAAPTASASAVVTIQASPGGSLSSVTLASGSVTGGQSVQGAFALSGQAGATASIASISCSDPAVTITPASITLAANSTGGTFSVATNAVTAPATLIISVTYNGVTQSASLTVNPPALAPPRSLASVSPSFSTVTGGTAVWLQFYLTEPAASGTTVEISSENEAAIPAPADIEVSEGDSSGTVRIPTYFVPAATLVRLWFSCGGVTKMVTVTLTPLE